MKSEFILDSEDHITELGLESCAASIIPENHIIICTRSGILKHTLPVGINKIPISINQDLRALSFAPDKISSIYFLRWVQGLQKELLYAWRKQGATVESLEHVYIANQTIFFPPLDEQKSISAFLDRETGKLDLLIRDQKGLIALLQEKRQAMISNAVSKGLNPKAKMKDSGVDWLGEVPEHWEIKKLGRLCSRIGSGKTPTGGAEVYSDSGVMFIRSQNVYDAGLDLSDIAFISPVIDSEMAWSRVSPGDILINITGASIGRTCLVPDNFPNANVNQHVCVIRLFDQNLAKFISIQLKSYYFKRLIESIQDGGNRDSLNFEQISGFKVLVAPKGEAESIMNFLDEALGRVDLLIREAEEIISLMNEHRASLISEAVTGKIDVRHLA